MLATATSCLRGGRSHRCTVSRMSRALRDAPSTGPDPIIVPKYDLPAVGGGKLLEAGYGDGPYPFRKLYVQHVMTWSLAICSLGAIAFARRRS